MDNKPELMWIPLDDLYIDTAYQRNTASRASVLNMDYIRDNFNWAFCGALIVSKIGKQYAILDGQHRWKAAKARNDITELPCLVISGMDTQAQADGFVTVNTRRVNVHSFAKYHASVVAGEPNHVGLQEILDECGLEIPKHPALGGSLPHQTLAIGSLLKMMEVYSRKQMIWALSIIPEAYEDKKGQLRAQLIKALAEFIKREPDTERDVMVRTLRSIDPVKLEGNARAAVKINGGKSLDAYIHALDRAYKSAERKG